GILGEYLFDDRDQLSLNGLQNDVFLGSRIAFNDTHDTSILLGGIFDNESSSKLFGLEASRRFGSSLRAELEARFLGNINSKELILSHFKNDSFLRLSITKYF
ncbi:MAG: hypothetical protein OER83_07525, partial [Flavobacteriaceae bacterium]|nr:hypothetical protein [Flavobacteriaceae bacterium]